MQTFIGKAKGPMKDVMSNEDLGKSTKETLLSVHVGVSYLEVKLDRLAWRSLELQLMATHNICAYNHPMI